MKKISLIACAALMFSMMFGVSGCKQVRPNDTISIDTVDTVDTINTVQADSDSIVDTIIVDTIK